MSSMVRIVYLSFFLKNMENLISEKLKSNHTLCLSSPIAQTTEKYATMPPTKAFFMCSSSFR